MLRRLTPPIIAVLLALQLPAGTRKPLTASEVELALKKLNVVGSALYVAAHPDDENTSMLAWLSNERLVRAGYLSLTRGDGGQNLIGTEKGDLLGVIRTQELMEARRIDGAEQFFTRAIDFGYSKSAEETFRIWEREKLLADVVWVIRNFQPDVIITRFPTDGEGGHGQHTASALLAEEAFRAAADATRFPEQLSRVKPWQARRIFWNAWRPQIENRTSAMPLLLTIDLGTYNPLLGESYSEFAARSRSMHKSQGFGAPERRGTLPNYLELRTGDTASRDPFEGIDLTWSRITGGDRVGEILRAALSDFDADRPATSVPALLSAWREIKKLQTTPQIEAKKLELANAIQAATGLFIEATSKSPTGVPGSSVALELRAVNRSNVPMQFGSVTVPLTGEVKPLDIELKNNELTKTELTVSLPAAASYSHPYWLHQPTEGKGLYTVADQGLIGRADQQPALSILTTLRIGGEEIPFELPTIFRWTDRVRGDLSRAFVITPPVTLAFDEKVYLFPSAANRVVKVRVRSEGEEVSGLLRLRLPRGWGSKPEVESVNLKKGEEKTVTFAVAPSSRETNDRIAAEMTVGNARHSRGIVNLDYEHIQQQTLFPEATARIVRIPLNKGKEKIGYVMGSGDDVPDLLRQTGYQVFLVTDEELATGELGLYDTIITGIRAFNTRELLKQHHGRLMEYVKAGGTMIVQYNTTDETLATEIGPYPLKLSRDRVTVEGAPVTILDPAHPLLNRPNRITAQDFEGWVQERGLYFAGEWDPKYAPLLASHDPGETDRTGGTLVTRYGQGTYIYTGYAWFRQLPAGVPGAYKLFVNMISAGEAAADR